MRLIDISETSHLYQGDNVTVKSGYSESAKGPFNETKWNIDNFKGEVIEDNRHSTLPALTIRVKFEFTKEIPVDSLYFMSDSPAPRENKYSIIDKGITI